MEKKKVVVAYDGTIHCRTHSHIHTRNYHFLQLAHLAAALKQIKFYLTKKSLSFSDFFVEFSSFSLSLERIFFFRFQNFGAERNFLNLICVIYTPVLLQTRSLSVRN